MSCWQRWRSFWPLRDRARNDRARIALPQRRQMMLAARELQADCNAGPEPTAFSALDSEDLLYGDEDAAG